MYSVAGTPQLPPSLPHLGSYARGAIWSAKIGEILCKPLSIHIIYETHFLLRLFKIFISACFGIYFCLQDCDYSSN